MENILTEVFLVERAKQLEEKSKKLYDTLSAAAGEEGTRDVFDYLAKQGERREKDLNKIGALLKKKRKAVPGYEDKFSLYISPSMDSWIFTEFEKKAEHRTQGIESSIRLMIDLEKEALLFYYGLKEILPKPAALIVEQLVDQRRDDILTLQNLQKELSVNVDELLVTAMNGELMAKRFYENASAIAQSKAGKKFFHDLASFEQSHFEKIKQIIESRARGAEFQPFAAEKVTGVKPEVEGEFEPSKNEIVDVLILGIRAERSAQKRYRKIAELMDDPQGKEIFENLAEVEGIHEKVLEDEFYNISNKGTIVWGE